MQKHFATVLQNRFPPKLNLEDELFEGGIES